MSSYPIIVLEGPDGAGKTTLANELALQLGGRVLHLTYRWGSKMWLYHQAAISTALLWSKKYPVIIDRWWPSEVAYANVYRGGSNWPMAGRMFEKIALKHGVIYVFCQPQDKESYLQHFHELKQSRQEMYSEGLDKVYDEFTKLRSSTLIKHRPGVFDYDFMKGNFQENVQQIIELSHDFRAEQWVHSLRPNFMNITGHMNYAKYLLIGDISNPKTRRPALPFFEYGKSSLWLAETLANLDIPEHELAFTNAEYHGPGPQSVNVIHKAHESGLKIVSMGQRARLEVYKTAAPNTTICHPQYYRRFEPVQGILELAMVLNAGEDK